MTKFTSDESDLLYGLIENLTGTCQKGNFKKDILLNNIERRVGVLGYPTLALYLDLLSDDDEEFQHFLSLVTIHTTFWFRENPHFKKLEEIVLKKLNESSGVVDFKIWTSACSTGQEAYTIALVLEQISIANPRLKYEVFASDIDPISVKKAKKGIYPISQIKSIPTFYHQFLTIDAEEFHVKENVRSKIKFRQASLLDDLNVHYSKSLDVIFCRNVLIYFDQKTTLEVIKRFENYLKPNGTLVLGHSENFDTKETHFRLDNNSCYLFSDVQVAQLKIDAEPFIKSFNNPRFILIGASTGGPETLEVLLKNFPKPTPPIIVVQHINPGFTESFARRLAQLAGLECRDTRTKVPLENNGIYIAWGDYHLNVIEENNLLFLKPNFDSKMNGHRPSVDCLFESATKVRAKSIAILLTGMGKDGAEGLLKLKRTNRCLTMAQNKESCVVYGMPKEAIERGATFVVGSVEYLSNVLRDYVKRKSDLKIAS